MITVFGRATSVNVQAVTWGLAELGLAFERLDYGHDFGGVDTPEFLAMNPNGLVPVLRDEDVTLWESAAILRYLAARHGEAPFWPDEATARAPIDMWAEWGKGALQRDFLGPIFWPIMRKAAVEPDATALERALTTFDGRLAILEAQLGERPFVMGDDFTLADVAVGSTLYRYFTLDIPRTVRPTLSAYYARLVERPGYATHVMVSYDVLRVPAASETIRAPKP